VPSKLESLSTLLQHAATYKLTQDNTSQKIFKFKIISSLCNMYYKHGILKFMKGPNYHAFILKSTDYWRMAMGFLLQINN